VTTDFVYLNTLLSFGLKPDFWV